MNLYVILRNNLTDTADYLGLVDWGWLNYVPILGAVYNMIHVYKGESATDYSGGMVCDECDDAIAQLQCAQAISAQASIYSSEAFSSSIPKLGIDFIGAGIGLFILPVGWYVGAVLAIDGIAGVSVAYHIESNISAAAKSAIASQCHCQ